MNQLDIWIPAIAFGYGATWLLVLYFKERFEELLKKQIKKQIEGRSQERCGHTEGFFGFAVLFVQQRIYRRVHREKTLHRWSVICLIVGGLWTLQNLFLS